MELEQKNSARDDAERLIARLRPSMTNVLLVCDIQGRIQQVDQAPEVWSSWTRSGCADAPF